MLYQQKFRTFDMANNFCDSSKFGFPRHVGGILFPYHRYELPNLLNLGHFHHPPPIQQSRYYVVSYRIPLATPIIHLRRKRGIKRIIVYGLFLAIEPGADNIWAI